VFVGRLLAPARSPGYALKQCFTGQVTAKVVRWSHFCTSAGSCL
jgi:hypothetical protein